MLLIRNQRERAAWIEAFKKSRAEYPKLDFLQSMANADEGLRQWRIKNPEEK